VKALVDFFGQWEEIPGRECYVLRTDYSGSILGFASKDGDRVLILADVMAQIKAATS
jgi:hypothetical protein